VSTVGIADRLSAFFQATRAELAVSLNAPDDERRRAIIPVAARYDLETLRAALLAALPRRRRVLFQYALFAGFNDAPRDAELLADYVRPVRCRVNLITANPGPDPLLCAPRPERVEAFVDRLHRRRIRTIVRRARGVDVGGACGQLAGAYRQRTAAASCGPPPASG
jgi:23S rRNA (adenine2503-C2)-methyltransferase